MTKDELAKALYAADPALSGGEVADYDIPWDDLPKWGLQHHAHHALCHATLMLSWFPPLRKEKAPDIRKLRLARVEEYRAKAKVIHGVDLDQSDWWGKHV
jgi:hypothetical protein